MRIESQPGFILHGVKGQIRGLFATAPDFQQTVPAIWRALRTAGGLPPGQERVGVVDVSGAGELLPYWAGSVMEEGPACPPVWRTSRCRPRPTRC